MLLALEEEGVSRDPRERPLIRICSQLVRSPRRSRLTQMEEPSDGSGKHHGGTMEAEWQSACSWARRRTRDSSSRGQEEETVNIKIILKTFWGKEE